jgi:hypothetical protein
VDSLEMHTAVKLGLDKSEGLAYPHFETEELDYWLNVAVDRFIKTRYSGNNLKRQGFEQSQKRTDDLYTLVEEARLVPVAGAAVDDKPNAYLVDTTLFPDDYMLFLNDEVSITYSHEVTGTAVTGQRTGVTECSSDNYYTKVSDPYGAHILHMSTASPLRMFSSKGVELITDGNYTIPYYYIRYIRKPAVIEYNTTDCDLPEHTHSEIVDLTVKILIENIESPRYQTNTMEYSQNE